MAADGSAAAEINATPFYDASDNPTGCCPRFNPEGWDGVTLSFRDKPVLRARTRGFAHVPLNMGKVFSRVQRAFEAAGAAETGHFLVLSRDLSAFTAEHLFAVDRAVPGEEMATLAGDFLTRVFDGPYSAVAAWYDEMQALARSRGFTPGRIYFFYTTCPKCRKVYGTNPVVGFVELLPAA